MPNQICKTFSEITLYKKNTLLAIEKYQEIKVKGEKSEFKYERNNGLPKMICHNYKKMIFQKTRNSLTDRTSHNFLCKLVY